MADQSDQKFTSFAAMPGILVVLTLGYLFVMHVGLLVERRASMEWSGRSLEAAYLDAGDSEVREPVNRVRARLGLIANDVVQRDGELFYLPDIEHVMGRSFLAVAQKNRHVVLKDDRLAARAENPVPAILDFDRQLRERGIRLVLLPTPSKTMFAGPEEAPIRNAGFTEFLLQMEANDIPVIDLAPHFAKCGEGGSRRFMKTDSHWTPEAMRIGAILLTAFLDREGLLPEGADEQFRGETVEFTGWGDLAVLWDGGAGPKWQETIAVHPVSRRKDRLDEWTRWVPDRESPLLMLGDSFTNVFSLGEMGWGEDGGFAEALSQSVGYSVDRIARNAEGAFASREALQQDVGRLEEKKVVVWQFAARELSFGDWKLLELPEGQASRPPVLAAGTIKLEGTIVAVAPVPALTRTPYRQAVMEVHLTGVRSENAELPDEVVLLGLGVEDRKPTGMTTWRVGQDLKAVVVPWGEVEDRYARLHRFAVRDPELELLEVVRVWRVD